MHIGRAPSLPPDHLHQQAAQLRASEEAVRATPAAVAANSAPTGDSGDPMPTYHPVTDLIQRLSQLAAAITDAPPPAPVAAQAYSGTPPAPAVLDMRA